jgi:predicted class III extradiol MEMO1 family dioxygenase
MSSHTSSQESYSRRPHHAGSWYSNDAQELDRQLGQFLDAASTETRPSSSSSSSSSATPRKTRVRAVICPHAGYSYSGSTAAYAYQAVAQELHDPDTPIRQILVLHPSHHEYLDGCAVSGATTLQTPLGDLTVDDHLRQEVLSLGGGSKVHFSVMNQRVDEHEHSGEMQYPFLAKAMASASTDNDDSNSIGLNSYTPPTVLPVMCGSLSTQQEQEYGRWLAEIIHRPSVLTVVSTDFCHWGARFRFTPTADAGKNNSSVPIHSFIEQMDRRGMTLIEMQQPGGFAKYLKETRNTICGRHAVAVWMQAVAATAAPTTLKSDRLQVRFVKYAQSSAASNMQDSSVSYAAAVATTTTTTTAAN